MEKEKSKIITIPNILSVVRLALIPLMVWLYGKKEDYLMTLVVLIISGLTDIVDGFIARRFNMISDVGKIIDPVADKLTQIAMVFCLSTNHPKMIVPVVLLIIKELSAGITNIVIIKKKHQVNGAVWHGKATTVLLYSMIFIHILWIDIPSKLSNLLIAASILMMAYSCVLYMSKNIKILSDNLEER